VIKKAGPVPDSWSQGRLFVFSDLAKAGLFFLFYVDNGGLKGCGGQ